MMINKLTKNQEYVPFILRIGLGLVFFIFGIDKFFRPEYWIGWMPDWTINLVPFNINYFMYFQGIIETIIGLLLILGLFTRIAALASVLTLGLIILTFFLNPTSINHFSLLHIDKDIFPLLLNGTMLRDIGLLAIAISLFLLGGGKVSLDNYLNKTKKVLRIKHEA